MNRLEVKTVKDNTHIENSYLIKLKKSMENEIRYIIELRKIKKLPVTRSVGSYVREWRGHNRLYKWNIARSHTRDVDLNENNNIFEELIWLILGGI